MLKFFKKILCNGVLFYGIIVVLIGLVIGVVLNYVVLLKIFVYVYSVSVLLGMIFWFIILISYIGFRKVKGVILDKYLFKMLFVFFINYLMIVFLLMVLVGMWFNDDMCILLIVGVIFLVFVVISYYVFGIGKCM